MKIVVLDGYTANPGDISWKPWNELGDVTIYDRTAPSELLGRAEGADALLTNKVIISKETMQQLPSLKYIGVLATGYNVVDISAAHELGITVTNIPAYSTNSVAQMVFAHLLNITQQVAAHNADVVAGRWQDCEDFCFRKCSLLELDGMSIGIVGFGNTGSATARIAHSFGMKVFAFTSKTQDNLPDYVTKLGSLDQLFSTCDVVSLHCPLTDSTRHLVNAARLKLMKPTAIVINTGRGPLVNDQDLADALNSGQIYAAGIDVLTQEPPRDGNPLIGARNCFITPHIAWATDAARQRLMQIALDNIRAFVEGKPMNVVNHTI